MKIKINGYAETKEALAFVKPEEGLKYNVWGEPFDTYEMNGSSGLSNTQRKTDVIGWYENLAELKSAVSKPNDKDVYIVGSNAPYTRYKATVRGTAVVNWTEDGEEARRINRRYATASALKRGVDVVEDNNFYAVGKEAPYEVWGVCCEWENIGMIISGKAKDKNIEAEEGEVYLIDGEYWMKVKTGWKLLTKAKTFKDAFNETFVTDKGEKLRLREGFTLGTYEFYPVKE